MSYVWYRQAWDDYLYWQQNDRKVVARINELLRDIERNGESGIGRPELLKHGFSGYSSRRITREHRVIYNVVDSDVRIASCRYHYGT